MNYEDFFLLFNWISNFFENLIDTHKKKEVKKNQKNQVQKWLKFQYFFM